MKHTLVMLHQTLVRNGKYLIARRIFHLLTYKSVCLGLGDIDYAVECLLTDCGFTPSYSRNGNWCRFYLREGVKQSA